MPRKSIIVQWLSCNEFKETRDLLYCENEKGRRSGIDRVKAWKARSRKLPVAVDCTVDIVEILNQTSGDNFMMASAMIITRLVNLHTEELQRGGRSIPVHELAKQIDLPKWIVDIRHQGTHGHMPDRQTLEGALRFCLDWLKKSFWDPQVERMEDGVERSPGDFDGKDRDKIYKAVVEYMEFMPAKMGDNITNGKKLDDVLRSLKKPLRGIAGRNYLAYLLSQDGYLVPTHEQERALGIDSDGEVLGGMLPSDIKTFWMPFLNHFKQFCLEPFLVSAIVQQLSSIAGQPVRPEGETVKRYLVGWAKELIKRDGVTSASDDVNMEVPPKKRRKRVVSWNKTVEACIMKPNQHSLELLPSLLPLADDPPLSEAKQKKILQVVKLMVQGTNGLPPPSNGLPSMAEMEKLIAAKTREDRRRGMKAFMMEDDEREKMERGQGKEAPGRDVKPWSICGDAVDWRRIPLGLLPGQPMDPSLFQLSGSSESKRKWKMSSGEAMAEAEEEK